MKKIFLSVIGTLLSTAVFCQEPTTVKKENLKGNVFSVRTLIYDYSENFGNPTEGRLQKMSVAFFDNLGRSILYNFRDRSYGDKYGLVFYKDDGENTIAEVSIFDLKKRKDELKSTNELIYDKILEEIYGQKREIIINNGIVIKHDVLYSNSNTSKFKLSYRKIAKPIGNGTYECKLYDESGKSILNFKETYNSKGQLTELDNEKEFSGFSSPDGYITIPHAGKYIYNDKGQLLSYTEQKRQFPNKTEYVYNDNGDLVQKNKLVFHQSKKEHVKNGEILYNDYKYDENGNWIYRVVSDGKQNLYIEKRQIDYCNTSGELEETVKDLYSRFQVTDIRIANEFADFYDKYLGKYCVAEVPLIDYDSSYATVKNADKASVVIEVKFGGNFDGSYFRRLIFPEKYRDKMIKIAKEINTKHETTKYSYKNGILIMNNEQYAIDENGTLKNITRNFSFVEGEYKEKRYR